MIKSVRFLYLLVIVLTISALAGIDSLLPGTKAQSNRLPTTQQAGRTPIRFGQAGSDETTGIFVITYANGKTQCRQATVAEKQTLLQTDPNLPLHIISPLRSAASNRLQSLQSQTGLQVILRGTTQLEASPRAKAGFLRAAAHWESLIRNPITIVIDVDFGTTRFGVPFGSGVLGSTSTQSLTTTNGYDDVRSRLVTGVAGSQFEALVNALPTGTLPTDIGSTSAVTATSSNLRALGILNPVADPTTETDIGSPPSIGFNSAFSYDYEPNDGVQLGIDFDSVATHEIGHALGFISRVGNKELSPSATLSVSTWDLFRFRPGIGTTSFTTTSRVLSSGGTQVFYDGSDEVAVSTGRPDGSGGDGRQPSHWKDDTFGGRYIGIMDPTASDVDLNLISNDDMRMLALIGYQITFPATSGLEELAIDDGTPEVSGKPFTAPGQPVNIFAVNRLTPSKYPSTLRKIRFFLRQVDGQPNPFGERVRVLAYADTKGTGTLAFENRPVVDQTIIIPDVGPSGKFVELDIPLGPTIGSGDWYVGYQLPNAPTGVTFSGDTNGVQRNVGFGGVSFFQYQPLQGLTIGTGETVTANLLIRAVVSSTACGFVITPNQKGLPGSGGNGSVNVATPDGCQWEAESTAPWLTTNSSGSGNGVISFNAPNNLDVATRLGYILVGDQILEVAQSAPITIGSSRQTLFVPPAPAGQCLMSDQFSVMVPATAIQLRIQTSTGDGQPTQFFVRRGQPVSGDPSNPVADFKVDPTGTLFINPVTSPPIASGKYYVAIVNCIAENSGGVITATIYGQPCPYSLSPSSANFTANGGHGSFSINTLDGCGWQINNNLGFGNTLIGSSLGDSQTQVEYEIFPNPGVSRSGLLRITGLTSDQGTTLPTFNFNITQDSGCTFNLPVKSTTIPPAGGSGSAVVQTSDSSCGWHAVNNSPGFVSITSNTDFQGNGTVKFSVPANNGPQRTGTLTLAGQTFSISQDSNCSYSIGQSSKSLPADGGTGIIDVNTSPACTWTATSNDNFINISSGGNGTGPGQVSFSVTPNPAGQIRNGTLTVAGQTFTVTQAGDCGFSIDATQQSFDSTGGTATVNVTSNGCHWTAVSNNTNFITINSGSSGDVGGPVGFTVATNNGPARTGTMTIAEKTFVVNQAAPPCFTTLSADSVFVQTIGGSASVQVNSPVGCNYSVASNADYMTITSGNNGSGPVTVTFDVAENSNLEPRAGTLTIAGLTVLVTQGGTNGVHYGDLNQDGKVNVTDLVFLANFLAGNTTIPVLESADVVLDHKVNVLDLLTLANELAGNIRFLPALPVLNQSSTHPPIRPLSFFSLQTPAGAHASDSSAEQLFWTYASATDQQQSDLFCVRPECVEQRRKSITRPRNSLMDYHY